MLLKGKKSFDDEDDDNETEEDVYSQADYDEYHFSYYDGLNEEIVGSRH